MGIFMGDRRKHDRVARWILAAAAGCIFLMPVRAQATQAAGEAALEEIDFTELDEFLDVHLSEEEFSFSGLVTELISGESDGVFLKYLKMGISSVLTEFDAEREAVKKIILLGIAAALFANLAGAFAGGQVADTGFYLIYIMLVTILLGAFTVIAQLGEEVVEEVLAFMRVLVPTWFLAAGLAGSQTQALVFYELTVAVISLVEWLFLDFVLPAIQCYLMISLVSSLAEGDPLRRLAGLMRTVIEWSMKLLLGAVVGIHVIQGLALSAVDSQTVSALQKLLGVVPGIGAGAETAAGLLIGSGRIIKNGIGGAALVLIVLIGLVPILKLCVFYFMYQGTAALMQPISDPRFLSCLQAVADGCGLVIRVLISVMLMFMITIAIVCMSTGGIGGT